MKRTLIVSALLTCVVFAASASGLEIGPTAMLKFPFSVSEDLATFSGIGIEDFKFGGDIELGLGPIQLGAMLDYKPGREEGEFRAPASVEAFVTAGLLLDLKLIRIGAGVGPTLVYDIPPKQDEGGTPPPPPEGAEGPGDVGLGLGVKANADIVFGRLALRLNVISGFDILRMAAADNALEYVDLKLGLSALIRL